MPEDRGRNPLLMSSSDQQVQIYGSSGVCECSLAGVSPVSSEKTQGTLRETVCGEECGHSFPLVGVILRELPLFLELSYLLIYDMGYCKD